MCLAMHFKVVRRLWSSSQYKQQGRDVVDEVDITPVNQFRKTKEMYFEEKFSYSHSKRRAKNGVKGRGAFGKSAAGGEYKDTTLAICQKASTLGISDHEAPQEKRGPDLHL